MPFSLTQGPTTFWRNANANLNTLVAQNGLQMVMLSAQEQMTVLLRNAEQLFTDWAAANSGSAKVIINGHYYDITTAGYRDAMWGSDPIEPSETIPLGRLVNRYRQIGGSAQRQMFHLAQLNRFVGPVRAGRNPPLGTLEYETGFGAAPTDARTVHAAIGGLGPIIIGGLAYGTRNRYRSGVPSGAPTSGPPGAAAQPFLTQRSNNTYRSLAGSGNSKGKAMLAVHSTQDRLLVMIQEDGTSGIALNTVRDRLVALGFDHAVFLDGSDSACLWHNGRWVVRPGSNKNETNTIGLAFG